MRSEFGASLPVLAELLAPVSAASAPYARDANQFPPANSTASSIVWGPCPPTGFPKALQCANFSVPINWDEPYGEHFDLGMVKLPATLSNRAAKIGSVFINPGGPGASAASIVATLSLGAIPTGNLRESFDLIGLDPRGVGMSHQVQCDKSILTERVSMFPQTEKELETLIDRNRRLGESCRKLTGPLFDYLDTISTAKDHEAVRISLDNKPINFIGISYGSQLAAQYAALFPNNIRTLALDGMLQHSQPETTNLFIDTTSYELGLTHFFDWAARNNSSALKGQDVKALWTGLIEKATTTPIPAPSCNNTMCRSDVNAEEILFNARKALSFYGEFPANPNSDRSWKFLSRALLNATQGDASSLSSDLTEGDNTFLSISCQDWVHSSKTLDEIRNAQTMADSYAPYSHGATETWKIQHLCLGWPSAVTNPPKKLNIKTNATVLVVAATADPSTGMPWAVGMMEEIENAVMLVRRGDGHTSFALGGEAANIMYDYVVSGKAPKAGTITTS